MTTMTTADFFSEAKRLGCRMHLNAEEQRAAFETKDAEISKLTAELAEADRRAGAAERRMADLEDTISKANHSRDRMKEEAGYHTNVSFDVVWAETLAKAKN